MIRGKFIVLEGLEGAGKSTAHQAILAQLSELGIDDVVLTREPGGTPLAEKLRHLIKHDLEEPICDKAELFSLMTRKPNSVPRLEGEQKSDWSLHSTLLPLVPMH